MQNNSALHRLKNLSKDELIEIILQNQVAHPILRQSEEGAIYQKIFDESTDALFLTHIESFQILLCNDRAVQMFDMETKAEFLGNFGYLFRRYPVGKDTARDFVEGNEEIEYVSKKGRVFWGLKIVRIIQIKNRDYRLVRITEISRLKEQEEKNRIQDQLYRSVVNTQQEMVCRFTPDTTLTFVNEAYCRNLGKSSEELLGVKFLELIPSEEHQWIKKRLKNVVELGKPLTNEHIVKAANGQYYWHQWTDIPIFDQKGNLVEFQAVGLDVSSRVQVEKRFRQSEEKFRTLVMAVPVGIFLTDTHGHCNWINQQMEEMCRISFQDALGDGLYRKILEEDRRKILSFWKNKGSIAEAPFRQECRYSLDNEIRWARFSLNPLRGDEQEVVGYVGIVEDFTDRKRYEQELLSTKAELEMALKAKDEFLSVMSHEVRTPLNAIVGLTHLMSEQLQNDELEEIVSTLRFSSNHLLTLVNDILDFSKIRAGKLRLEHIPLDLKELLHQTINLFHAQAQDKEIDLILETDSELPATIMGDPTRMSQILNNLVSNAIKFTAKGAVNINVSRHDKSTLLIRVQDTGIGMTPDEQRRIFNEFTQANSATNRKYGGTGLGLTITENLVKLQKGKITFSSEAGKGTVFSVFLPLQVAKRAVGQKKVQKAKPQKVEGLSILYVEDVVPNQLLIKGFCRQWGAVLDIASSGQEALDKLRKKKTYDLVLMDIMMPGLDGYQTTQLIRKMEGEYYQHLPVLAVTASVSGREANKYLQYGLNDFVVKPISPDELLQKIIDNVDIIRMTESAKTKKQDRAPKNMFSLLQEYHEQNPDEYSELLQSSDIYIRKYRERLLHALETQNEDEYRQTSHKLINLLMLFQENDFVHLLESSSRQFQKGQPPVMLEEKLQKAFNSFFEKKEHMLLKSKNLLN